ncbi:MAG: Transposase-like protein [Cenarchaeum symbiont of Oopsacas minuta]|nr:Transposase-like protein [Cenarchaeum symbiont of Oopsacas minuta]
MIARLHAMCLMQIRGLDMTETASSMFRTYQFVYKWHDRYQKYGLKGLEERSRCGRPPLVCSHTMMQMEKTFTETGTMILPKQVREYIKNKTGITYHITHVYRIMRGWKLEAKVPQKIHASALIVLLKYIWTVMLIV